MCSLRADNVSVVTVMLDPPGPPRAKVLRRLHGLESPHPKLQLTQPIIQPNKTETPASGSDKEPSTPTPSKGIAIISRFPNSRNESEQQGTNLVAAPSTTAPTESGDSPLATRIVHDSSKSAPMRMLVSPVSQQQRKFETENKFSDKPKHAAAVTAIAQKIGEPLKDKIQCSEVSSSDIECDSPAPPPVPSRPTGGHRPANKTSALATKPVTSSTQAKPVTRTRQQSGQTRPLPPSPKTPSPPPLPVKQIRRSIVPGYSGYNSDSENQPSHANTVTGLATPSGRHLRSSAINSAKKSSTVLSQAVTKTRRSDLASKASLETVIRTPEMTGRVLRSRNTPASVTQPRCDFRSRTVGHVETPQHLPETGVKRKRNSIEPGMPSLAAKMLKLGHAKSTSWINPMGKRNGAAGAARSAK